MNELNEYLHYRALAAKHDNAQVFAGLMDSVVESGSAAVPTRQIATVVAATLVDELDDLLAILKMTKRQFMEMALIDAMQKANEILDGYGVNDFYEDQAALAAGGAE
ncbi:MAG TPA: hypothetical protein VFC74_10000 [Oscillospiraceae bacterium]|nr:hypothetical protein [Oscillospiraceae bacterium]